MKLNRKTVWARDRQYWWRIHWREFSGAACDMGKKVRVERIVRRDSEGRARYIGVKILGFLFPRPARCPECGWLGGHTPDCFVEWIPAGRTLQGEECGVHAGVSEYVDKMRAQACERKP